MYLAIVGVTWGLTGSVLGLLLSSWLELLPPQIIEYRDPALTEVMFETRTEWTVTCFDERGRIMLDITSPLARLTAGGIQVSLEGTPLILHGVGCVVSGGRHLEKSE